MEFTSISFLFFFLPLFLLVYFLCKKRSIRNLILFVFSIFFYAWGEPLYIFLVLFSILINYFLTKKMAKNESKFLFIFILFIDILTLIFFKYVPFLIENINYLFNLNISIPKIALPIGISFYTFQMISYVIDVYKKNVNVQKNIIYLGCYIIAFPQLVAGPIVRYSTIEDELDNRKENIKDFCKGIERFILGLTKKVLIANVLGLISTNIFSFESTVYGFLGSWIGMICYSLQILYDFSGYSDMAIGLGSMMGFHYLENFNYPYIAKNITDFWHRWHISLSSFFKDYVYIPLGGNRVSTLRHIINILIVWSITGLWHGASINFILWGLYYGIILIVEKYFLNKHLNKFPNFIKHLYSILIIIFGWVLFRCDSFNEITNIFKSLIGFNGIGNKNLFFYINFLNINTVIATILSIIFISPKLENMIFKNNKFKYFILVAFFIFSICEIIVGSYNPFIYFRF